jgi:hypothetical protein
VGPQDGLQPGEAEMIIRIQRKPDGINYVDTRYCGSSIADPITTAQEAKDLAQQHSQAGNYQVYWRVEAIPVGSKPRRHEAQMVSYLLATKAAQLFPS